MQTGSRAMNKIKEGTKERREKKEKKEKKKKFHEASKRSISSWSIRWFPEQKVEASSSTGFRCLIVCQIHGSRIPFRGDGTTQKREKERKKEGKKRLVSTVTLEKFFLFFIFLLLPHFSLLYFSSFSIFSILHFPQQACMHCRATTRGRKEEGACRSTY